MLGGIRRHGEVRMKITQIGVESVTLSLDRYGAGLRPDLSSPLGVRGEELHQWAFLTRTFQRALFGSDGGTSAIDNDDAARGFTNVGAVDSREEPGWATSGILGRYDLEGVVGRQSPPPCPGLHGLDIHARRSYSGYRRPFHC